MSKSLDALIMLTTGIITEEQQKEYRKTIEKELKALEIIKVFFKGRVNLHETKYVKDEQGNYGYVHFITLDDKDIHIKYPISQKQYDLLKEVLL